MYRVLTCLTTQHDFRLVVLAAIVCSGAAYTAFHTYARALESTDARRRAWLFMTGTLAASGIWATHFVAMLAYDSGVPTSYDPVLTAASLMVAVLATSVGFWIAADGIAWPPALAVPSARYASLARDWVTSSPQTSAADRSIGHRAPHWIALPLSTGADATRAGVLVVARTVRVLVERTCRRSIRDRAGPAVVGGAVIGIGIAAMHFTGMRSLSVAGTIGWDMPIVVASIAVSIVLTSAALVAHECLKPEYRHWAAPGLLVLAICGLHFTAMGAVDIVPDPTVDVQAALIDSATLATAVAGVTMFVLFAGVVSALIEKLHISNASLTENFRHLETANENVNRLNIQLLENIQKLKEAQDEIVKKGKMAQLGQLTATVAHEIRNPLGTIKTSTQLLERKLKGTDLGIEKTIERINNGVARCDHIITELLDFARTRSIHPETTNVDAYVRAVVVDEASTLPANVLVSFHAGLGETCAQIDGESMRRVLVNLLSNASEAMVGKGNVRSAAGTRNPKIQVSTRLTGGNIEIAVKDNGPGIAEENISRILEPLFTTKSFGVGLGLPAVERILEQHGGGLRIDSRPGEGATFTAWFPLRRNQMLAA